MDEFHLKGGVSIHLKKYIPVAAGMAGEALTRQPYWWE